MNYVEQLKQQILTLNNERNKYISKYQKYKQLYFSSINSIQNQHLNYVFTLENYSSTLKKLEFELNTLEYFYNIYFSSFNIDSWFKKTNDIFIRRTIDEILLSFNKIELINKKSLTLGYLQHLRNFIMYNLKCGKVIKIYSIHLDEPFIALISKDIVQIINRFHSDSCIEIDDTKINLFNFNKHIILQFLFNPFWETSLYLQYDYSEFKIINKDDSIIDIPYEFIIDSRTNYWIDDFVADYTNYYFNDTNIDFDKYQSMIYDLILNYNIDNEIKNELWNLLLDMRQKLLDSNKVVFYSEFDNYDTEKKKIKWNFSKPQINLKDLSVLTSGKKNLFTLDEINDISKKKVMQTSPSDLGLILPCIMENNIKLLDVMCCYLQHTKELTQDPIRKEIIINQFKKLEKTNFYISYYGIDFLMHLLTRTEEENNYTILSAFIWDKSLWELNYIMTKISYLNFFDIINNNASIEWKDLHKLLNYNTSIESKIACLINAYYNNNFYPESVYFWDNNPYLMFKLIKDKSYTGKNFNIKSINFKLIEIPSYKNEVSCTNIYCGYLFDTQDIDKININKSIFRSFNSFNSITEFDIIITYFISQIMELGEIIINSTDNFIELKLIVNKFRIDNIYNLIIINSKLIMPNSIEFIISINNKLIHYHHNKYYYDTSSDKYIYIKVNDIHIEYIKYKIYSLN